MRENTIRCNNCTKITSTPEEILKTNGWFVIVETVTSEEGPRLVIEKPTTDNLLLFQTKHYCGMACLTETVGAWADEVNLTFHRV